MSQFSKCLALLAIVTVIALAIVTPASAERPHFILYPYLTTVGDSAGTSICAARVRARMDDAGVFFTFEHDFATGALKQARGGYRGADSSWYVYMGRSAVPTCQDIPNPYNARFSRYTDFLLHPGLFANRVGGGWHNKFAAIDMAVVNDDPLGPNRDGKVAFDGRATFNSKLASLSLNIHEGPHQYESVVLALRPDEHLTFRPGYARRVDKGLDVAWIEMRYATGSVAIGARIEPGPTNGFRTPLQVTGEYGFNKMNRVLASAWRRGGRTGFEVRSQIGTEIAL